MISLPRFASPKFSHNIITQMPPLDAPNMHTPEAGSPNPSHIIISPEGSIHVLSYTPTEGERGAPIAVQIHLQPVSTQSIYVRLVVGHQAVATQVRELQGEPYGRWQLHASAPAFDPRQSASSRLPLRVQLLNEDDAILDSVTFGEFSYWMPGSLEKTVIHSAPTRESGRPRNLRIAIASTSRSHLPTPSPTSPHRVTHASRRTTRLNRRSKPTIVRRTDVSKLGALSGESNAEVPILELVTSLSSICHSWTASELHAGRRLVHFNKIQDGARLIVSCESIKQEEYCESDCVISCIYHEDSKTCFVTSVDIIYLLERLTDNEFPVEEKNRIRRNLEGLRPTTVSKHRPGFEDFFQRIMEFPDPKPRNIEKDLKVFDWGLLSQALEKILSKYSIYTAQDSESSTDQPRAVSTPPAPSPELLPTTENEYSVDELSYPEPASVAESMLSPLVYPELLSTSDVDSGSNWISPNDLALDGFGDLVAFDDPSNSPFNETLDDLRFPENIYGQHLL